MTITTTSKKNKLTRKKTGKISFNNSKNKNLISKLLWEILQTKLACECGFFLRPSTSRCSMNNIIVIRWEPKRPWNMEEFTYLSFLAPYKNAVRLIRKLPDFFFRSWRIVHLNLTKFFKIFVIGWKGFLFFHLQALSP